MHQHISHQENLCTEIRMLDAELQIMKEKLSGLAAAGEMPSTLGELEAQLDPTVGAPASSAAGRAQSHSGGRAQAQPSPFGIAAAFPTIGKRFAEFPGSLFGHIPAPITRSKGRPFASMGK